MPMTGKARLTLFSQRSPMAKQNASTAENQHVKIMCWSGAPMMGEDRSTKQVDEHSELFQKNCREAKFGRHEEGEA